MYENNNKAIIKKISKRCLKVNKQRNIFAIIAIMLTTILFTSIFTIFASQIESLEYSSMRQTGSSAHGGFKNLTSRQAETLSKNSGIKEYGKSVFISVAQNKLLVKRQMELRYTDNNYARYTFVLPLIKGKMPMAENEIVLDTITLNMLKLKYKLGERINIKYNINGKSYSQNFILSGYYKGDRINSASFACVSEKFKTKALKDIKLKASKANGFMCGYTDMEVMLDNKYGIKSKLIKVIRSSGLSKANIDYGVNWAYIGSYLSNEDIIKLAAALFFIMLSGYMIIYNIFYISVANDIRFYGMLRTIGTTSRQLKKLIFSQAISLSLWGIPGGLIIGYVIGAELSEITVKGMQYTFEINSIISLNPVIFIGAAVFSFITVIISCIKPQKTAAVISPIDAIRYSSQSKIGKRKTRNSIHGGKIYRMAYGNILRDKKKTILAIISLSLSLVLLNSTYTATSGLNMDMVLNKFIGTDFTIGDTGFYTFSINNKNTDTITEQLCKVISNIKGVKKVEKIYSKEKEIPIDNEIKKWMAANLRKVDKWTKDEFIRDIDNNVMSSFIYGADPGIFKMLRRYVVKGKINNALLETGKYVVVAKPYFDKNGMIKVGKEISVTDDNNHIKKYKVMAIINGLPLYLYSGHIISGGLDMYMPSEEFRAVTNKPVILTALFNAKHEYISYIENYLKEMIKGIPSLDYRSRASYYKEYKSFADSFTYVGYALSFILAIIGLLNFTNVIINSMISRKQEFAALQSIGMTSKMLLKMVMLEGLYYAILTVFAALAVSIPISCLTINSFMSSITWYFKYSFTVTPIILCAPMLFMITIVIPLISYKNINKMSIVERLRISEQSI